MRHRIIAHVQLCWLALLLIGVAETEVGDTWRNIGHGLERIQLVTLATSYRDLGGDYFTRRDDPDRRRTRLVTQLAALGDEVELTPAT